MHKAGDNALTLVAEHVFKDTTKPDGDACRPDGTLKDASEMEWLDSPSAVPVNLPNLKENSIDFNDDLPSWDTLTKKRSLPSDGDESNENESVVAPGPKIKVS